MKPFVSIITCTLNSKKFIKQNIESVISQTYQNYEHIFIDGFSSDGTYEIIKAYQKNSPKRVRILQSPPKGISNAMNKGIVKSRGQVIIHLHSDDYFYDNKVLNDAVNFLTNNPSYDWIYGKINTITDKTRSISFFPSWKIYQLASPLVLKFRNHIPHQAVFIRKKVFNKFGLFDETLISSQDYDLWLRISSKTNYKFFDRVFTCYRVHKGAVSTSLKNKVRNIAIRKRVQQRYSNSLELFFIRAVNNYLDSKNKIYK